VLDASYGVHARYVRMFEYTLMIEIVASTFFLVYTALPSHAQHVEACWRPSCQARVQCSRSSAATDVLPSGRLHAYM